MVDTNFLDVDDLLAGGTEEIFTDEIDADAILGENSFSEVQEEKVEIS